MGPLSRALGYLAVLACIVTAAYVIRYPADTPSPYTADDLMASTRCPHRAIPGGVWVFGPRGQLIADVRRGLGPTAFAVLTEGSGGDGTRSDRVFIDVPAALADVAAQHARECR